MPKVTADPNICHGKACIAGTRIPVHIALDLLAAGETFDGIHKAYPHLAEKTTTLVLNRQQIQQKKKSSTNPLSNRHEISN